MSAPPYMKLFWGDYHKATRHLTRDQHGAYFLLIGEAWRLGGALPDDDPRLAAWALCTPEEWAAVKPIIMDFFALRRGKWWHDRVREELAAYEAISRKRKEAGKKGGSTTRGTASRKQEANASLLPPKPEPEPEPEEQTPKPLSLAPLSRLLELSSAGSFASLAESLFLAQPIVGGKRRSTRPDVAAALEAAIKRGGRPAEIVRAVRAYYALPDCQRDGGQFASGAKVVMAKDRWRDYLAPAAEPTTAPVTPEVQAHRRAHFAKTGEWKPGWGPRPDTPANDAQAGQGRAVA